MDHLNRSERSRNMKAIKSKGMKPELYIRQLIHKLGYRYRLHRTDLPGKPDLVFSSRKKVIFVHGCFWHQHASPSCKRSNIPKSNKDYWETKLKRNMERDKENIERLGDLGWSTMIIWECELKTTPNLEEKIQEFLEDN